MPTLSGEEVQKLDFSDGDEIQKAGLNEDNYTLNVMSSESSWEVSLRPSDSQGGGVLSYGNVGEVGMRPNCYTPKSHLRLKQTKTFDDAEHNQRHVLYYSA